MLVNAFRVRIGAWSASSWSSTFPFAACFYFTAAVSEVGTLACGSQLWHLVGKVMIKVKIGSSLAFISLPLLNFLMVIIFSVWGLVPNMCCLEGFLCGWLPNRESLGSKGNTTSAVWCMRQGFDPGWIGICFSKGATKGRLVASYSGWFHFVLTLWKQSRDQNPRAFITLISATSPFAPTGQNPTRG